MLGCYQVISFVIILSTNLYGCEGRSNYELIKSKEGILIPPSHKECEHDNSLTSITWEFPISKHYGLYINLESFTLSSCSNTRLEITSKHQSTSHCGMNTPTRKVVQSTTKVKLISNSIEFCSEEYVIKYAYINIIASIVSSNPSATRSNVAYKLSLRRIPDEFAIVDCQCYFGDGYSEIWKSFSTVVKHSFELPGVYAFKAICRLDGVSLMSQPIRDIVIEGNLTNPSVNLNYVNKQFKFASDVSLLFNHEYSYPLSYYFVTEGVSLTKSIAIYNPSQFRWRSPVTVQFELDEATQILLGPGVHNFSLTLENNVSSLQLTSSFILNKKLSNMKVATENHVGIYPNYFVINITFTTGAPANVEIFILNSTANTAISKTTTFCEKKCGFIQATTRLLSPGLEYKLLTKAHNSISNVSAMYGPFAATRRVYDVYLASPEMLYLKSKHYPVMFIRADIDEYTLLALVENKQIGFQFSNIQLEYTHTLTFPLPANPKFYKMLILKHNFQESGLQQVKITVKNSRVSSTYTRTIFVLDEKLCEISVRIRDGNNKHWKEKPIKVLKSLTLTLDNMIKCTNDFNLQYKWKFFRVESYTEMPNPERQARFVGDVTQPEIVIKPVSLPKGMYVAELNVIARDKANKNMIGEGKDYTLIQVEKKTIGLVILGGSRIEVEKISSSLKFETSISSKSLYNVYNWYCSITKEDLPYDLVTAKVKRKGSCFKSYKPLWVSNEKILMLFPHQLIESKQYFVRVFVSSPGFEPIYADQEFSFVQKGILDVKLRCFSNCGKKYFPQFPMILQLKCKKCSHYRWMLRSSSAVVLNFCKNMEFCKLNKEILTQLQPNENNRLVATGTYFPGNSTSSVTLQLQQQMTPRKGKCTTTPPTMIAYVTEFNVECISYDDHYKPLFYKFYLSDEEKLTPLLQFGYDNVLRDVSFPPSSAYEVKFIVKICNTIQACSEEVVATYVSPNMLTIKPSLEMDVALKSNNIQKVVQLFSYFPLQTMLTHDKILDLIHRLNHINPLCMETVKQFCDVLYHVTKHSSPDNTIKKNVWKILIKINKFMHKHFKHDDILLATRSCLTAASLLIYKSGYKMTKNDVSCLAAFGKFLMTSAIPQQTPSTFRTTAMKASFIRIDRGTYRNSRLVDEANLFATPYFNYINNDDDIFNLEMYRFNPSIVTFNTKKHRVDDVILVSMTTGWDKMLPISTEMSEKVTIRYPISDGNIIFSRAFLWHKNFSGKQSDFENVTGICYMIMDLSHEKLYEESVFHISIENKDYKLVSAKLTLHELGQDSPLQLVKTFNNARKEYNWTVSVTTMPARYSTYKLLIDGKLQTDKHNSTNYIELPIATYIATCLYWDYAVKEWNNQGCKPMIDESAMMCICSHYPTPLYPGRITPNENNFTMLASRVVTYPAKSIEILCSLSESYVSVIGILCIFLLFIPLIIWSKRKDTQANSQNEYIEVLDNSPYEKYRYLVTIYTGSRRNAGTTATVAMKLVGKTRVSRVHIIQYSKEVILKTGYVVCFLVTSSRRLGEMRAVKLWRDDSGDSPNWYLSRIAVTDLETNESWFIYCSWWLQPKIKYIFKVSNYHQLCITRNRLLLKLDGYLKDRHLWYSLHAMRPWQQQAMTYTERVVTNFVGVLMIMMTSAVLIYNKSCREDVFPHQWSAIVVGIQSALSAFPLLCWIHALFRLSHKWKRINPKQRDIEGFEETASDIQLSPSYSKEDALSKAPNVNARNSSSSSLKLVNSVIKDKVRKETINKKIPSTDRNFYLDILPSHAKQDKIRDEHNKGCECSSPNMSVGDNETEVSLRVHEIETNFIPNNEQPSEALFFNNRKDLKGEIVAQKLHTRQKQSLYKPTENSVNRRSDKLSKPVSLTRMSSKEVVMYWMHNSRNLPVPRGHDKKIRASEPPPTEFMDCMDLEKSDADSVCSYHTAQSSDMHPSAGVKKRDFDETVISLWKILSDFEMTYGRPTTCCATYYVTWCLVIMTGLASITISLYYGTQFGIEIFCKWLICVLVGVIKTAVILETVTIFAGVALVVKFGRKFDIADWIPPLQGSVQPREHKDKEVEQSRQNLERKKNPVYHPPSIAEEINYI